MVGKGGADGRTECEAGRHLAASTGMRKEGQKGKSTSSIVLSRRFPFDLATSCPDLNLEMALQVKFEHSLHAISCLLTTYSKTEALSEKRPTVQVISDASKNRREVLNTQGQMHVSKSVQLGTEKSVLYQVWDEPGQPG